MANQFNDMMGSVASLGHKALLGLSTALTGVQPQQSPAAQQPLPNNHSTTAAGASTNELAAALTSVMNSAQYPQQPEQAMQPQQPQQAGDSGMTETMREPSEIARQSSAVAPTPDAQVAPDGFDLEAQRAFKKLRQDFDALSAE